MFDDLGPSGQAFTLSPVEAPRWSGAGGGSRFLGAAAGSPLFAPLPPWPFGSLKPHYYQLVVADPAWSFELYSAAGEGKSAQAHYDCMPLHEIQALPVGELADPNCLCLLWVTAPMLPEGLATLQAWGFEYRSFVHWTKVFPSGKPAMACGYRVRSMGELVLVGTRGNPRHKPLPGNFPGVRREHSRKPDAFYDVVDARCRGLVRRADLFSRQSRSGWENWGKEQNKFDPRGDEMTPTPKAGE